jgi:hypothetical protein
MIVLGVLAGASLAATVLRYDGSQPVNAVTVFSVLVGVQAFLMFLTLLLIPKSVPGLRAVQGVIGQLNPATMVAAIYQRLRTARLPDSLAMIFSWHVGRAAAARFSKWQLLHLSQTAAIAFNIGALATALALVTFTDLAFGWSTTLQLSSSELAHWVRIISAPWATFLPSAVPDGPLIEGSRFFRLEQSTTTFGIPQSYTGWWQFLLASLAVYGLLPRIALWIVTGARLRAATRALLLDDPRVVALLDRMASPVIATTATDSEDPGRLRAAVPKAGRHGAPGASSAALVWAEATDAAGAQERAKRVLDITLDHAALAAGGNTTPDEDRAVIDRIGALSPGRIVVFVRAWEPPLLELTETLSALRERLGTGTSIIVNPVPVPGGSLEPANLKTWERGIGALGDPQIYVEAGR